MKNMLLVVLIIGFAVTVKAENTEGKKEVQLGDITVTAQKTEENLRDVPMSVSVFNDLVLEDQEIKDLEDLSYYVPNFFLMGDGGGSGQPSMRGISMDMATASSSVGLYVDGVPTINSVGFMALMNGVERVEVLRGPQGTLYGKNAQAGVINIITKKPGNEQEGQVYAELGEDNKHEVGVGLRTPIIKDKFYMGLTGRFYEKDGYLKNTYSNNIADDRKNYFGKLYLRLTPTDRLDISLISSRYETDNDAISRNLISAKNYLEIESDMNQSSDISLETYALNISYQFDNFTLESITSYQEKELDSLIDSDFSAEELMYYCVNIPYETLTQELRLKGENGKLKWLAGLYADKMEKTGGITTTSISPSYVIAINNDLEEK
ncbi:TonB-dependent receptor plug domain-containing protein [uncultured Desulfobacter sp.]|uniref:TonB-dependent receptor n=1 Tax=uncultured Desulfobacter sp. TaxID=240139 RepID=UPI0029F4E7BF|nr:TonB-dependent receptor plug domain-containing protein [uncultured Desulfobacter sp.]